MALHYLDSVVRSMVLSVINEKTTETLQVFILQVASMIKVQQNKLLVHVIYLLYNSEQLNV